MTKEEKVEEILRISGFKMRRGDSNIGIGCPLAPYSPLHSSNKDSRPSMGIKITDTNVLVNCFTCGFKARKLSFLYKRLAHHDSYWSPAVNACLQMESEEIMQGLSGMSYLAKKKKELKPFDEALFTPFSGHIPRYLMKRGVSIETAKRWGLGFDKVRKRAVFPVRDYHGQLWGCVGRSINGAHPKYLNYWEMKKGKQVLGAHLINTQRKIIVVEGVLDAVITEQALQVQGKDNQYGVVSILGASITSEQTELILKFSTEVILCFDNDEAGERGASLAKELISPHVMTKVGSIKEVNKKDFGECSTEEILYTLENSRFL
jgi:5S rRNA maturation endonuclease (ribonuclease M5)